MRLPVPRAAPQQTQRLAGPCVLSGRETALGDQLPSLPPLGLLCHHLQNAKEEPGLILKGDSKPQLIFNFFVLFSIFIIYLICKSSILEKVYKIQKNIEMKITITQS